MQQLTIIVSFPTQLFEPFMDGEDNLSLRPVYRDGQPVQCRDAAERRDRLIERLASLAPVQGALDQIVQRAVEIAGGTKAKLPWTKPAPSAGV